MSATTVMSPPRRVLADLLPGAVVRDIALVGFAAGLTGLAAQLSFHIPGTPVPITGQTFAVLLSGAALGWRRGLAAMVLYMVAGLVGVPWYAHHAAGYTAAAASFGYIVGFVVAGSVVGYLAGLGGDRTVVRTIGTMLVGTAIIYVLGAIWLAHVLHLGALATFNAGVRPFLIGDAIKGLLAAGVLPLTWRAVGGRSSSR